MDSDKLRIYVDCFQLHKLLYKAQFEMCKKDRVVVGNLILEYNAKLFAHIAMANNCKEERLKYIEKFISDFEILKMYLRLIVEENIISNDGTKFNIFDYISKIDKAIYGWVVSIICLFVGLAMLEWAIETGAMIALEGMALISSFVVFSNWFDNIFGCKS